MWCSVGAQDQYQNCAEVVSLLDGGAFSELETPGLESCDKIVEAGKRLTLATESDRLGQHLEDP